MKKIMIAMSAVAIAFGLNAATVDWQILISSSATSYASGYTAYLVNASAWDNAEISAATFSDSSIVLDSTTFDSGAGKGSNKTYTTLKADAATAGGRSVSIASLAEASTLDVYYVILNTSSDPNTYYKWSDTLTGRAESGSEALGSNFSIAGSTINAATWTAVPEPTSGLLMLLGMAGLALRRKRA